MPSFWKPIAYRIRELPPTVKSGIPRPTLGYGWKQERRIDINPKQVPHEFLDTAIHEALHVLFPKYSERRIVFLSWCLAGLLWRLGYRRQK